MKAASSILQEIHLKWRFISLATTVKQSFQAQKTLIQFSLHPRTSTSSTTHLASSHCPQWQTWCTMTAHPPRKASPLSGAQAHLQQMKSRQAHLQEQHTLVQTSWVQNIPSQLHTHTKLKVLAQQVILHTHWQQTSSTTDFLQVQQSIPTRKARAFHTLQNSTGKSSTTTRATLHQVWTKTAQSTLKSVQTVSNLKQRLSLQSVQQRLPMQTSIWQKRLSLILSVLKQHSLERAHNKFLQQLAQQQMAQKSTKSSQSMQTTHCLKTCLQTQSTTLARRWHLTSPLHIPADHKSWQSTAKSWTEQSTRSSTPCIVQSQLILIVMIPSVKVALDCLLKSKHISVTAQWQHLFPNGLKIHSSVQRVTKTPIIWSHLDHTHFQQTELMSSTPTCQTALKSLATAQWQMQMQLVAHTTTAVM